MGGTTPEGGGDGNGNGNSDSDNDERNDAINENENSPESAGLARGLARSAAPRGAGNVAVGRLPLRSSGPTSSVAAASNVTTTVSTTARTASSRMTRIQRVAKVSDRASTGFDFVEAHQESATTTKTTETNTTTTNANDKHSSNNKNNSNTNGSQPPSVKKDSWRIRVSNFAGSLAKNTILGAAVFAAYEEMIDRFEDVAEKKYQQKQNRRVASSPSDGSRIGGNGYDDGYGDSYDEKDASSFSAPPPTQLSQHYAAGFCAGCVHACLGRLFEGVSLSSLSLLSPKPPNIVSPNGTAVFFRAAGSAAFAFLPNVLHHATSHAVLFGSYETVKRMTNAMVTVWRTSLANPNAKTSEIDNDDESAGGGGYLVDDDLVAVALAGGIAGIGQQVVGDVAKQLTKALQLGEPGAAKGTLQTPTVPPSLSPPTTMSMSMPTMRWWLATMKPPRYSARSLGMVSVPTAIGFVAFEYGREAVTTN